MTNKKIVLLCQDCDSTNIVYNALITKFNFEYVICEKAPSRRLLIKRRCQKLGVFRVIGQLFFQVIIQKLLRYAASDRIEEILRMNNLNKQPIEKVKMDFVNSVNSEHVIKLLQKIMPDIIVINGTRIINESVLTCVSSTFINTHMGITPKYRGVHGAYWALINKDKNNCGVTIHFVDKGIDTGNIIAQSTIEITELDNFATYPYLQISKAIPLLLATIKGICCNSGDKIAVINNNLESILWYHPTIWEYCYFRIYKGIK